MIAINPFKIGADPEFYAITKSGDHHNIKGYTTKEAADVAFDHNGDVLEVKPAPSKYAFRVVRRIKKLLLEHQTTTRMLSQGLRFRAGGRVTTATRNLGLGGHIHIDIPFDKDWQPQFNALHLIRQSLEDFDILPQKDSKYRNQYQHIDPVRKANDANRLEYRSMCSWLHSPVAAQLCLTAGKLAAAQPSSVVKVFDSVAELRGWFEKFKTKDWDAARVVEKIFEPKLKLEARIDVDLEDSWKSLKRLGGIGSDESSSAL